jgi:hypothetical protein
MTDPATLAELLRSYRDAADQSDDLTDLNQQREVANEVHYYYKKLRDTTEGQAGIVAMMEDPSPHVRSWAAAHSLQWAPERARRVLESLRDENVFPYSFDAEMTLEEYAKGRLSFDY